jgi:8-oxo-dGTP pyrophosphatase MutT (NUDIX family)
MSETAAPDPRTDPVVDADIETGTDSGASPPTDLPGEGPQLDMDLRVGAYAIVHEESRGVLLAHWQEGSHGGWTLPGGGMEPGEHPEQTVVREVAEETGYRVSVEGILGVGSIIIPGTKRLSGPGRPLQGLRIVYRCTILGGDLVVEKKGSTDDVGWFTLEQIAGLQRVGLVDEGLSYVGLTVPTLTDPAYS